MAVKETTTQDEFAGEPLEDEFAGEPVGVSAVKEEKTPEKKTTIGEEAARKGLAIATGLTEVIPGATQAVAGLRSAFGERPYKEELRRVREEQAMVRKAEPVTTGLSRGAGTVGLAIPAAALGGPVGLAGLSGTQALSRGEDVRQAATEAALTGVAGPVLSRLPSVVQAALPVGASVGGALGAKDESAMWESLLGLAPMATTAVSQGVRSGIRALGGRAEKAGEQILSSKGSELVAARAAELEEADKAVQSAIARRRQLTGEQQTRLANAPRLEEAGGRMGFAPAPQTLLPTEATPEARAAYESFFRNAPEKFTSEPAEVAAKLAAAKQAQEAAQQKWSDPLAVAAGMSTTGPTSPRPIPPELMDAARLLQQREIAAAKSRVPSEIGSAAKARALLGVLTGGAGYLVGARSLPVTAGPAAMLGTYGAGRKIQQLVALDPKTKAFKDPAAANVIYDAIPSVVRKFPSLSKYLSLATDAGIRSRPVFLMQALQRDPDFARAVEEEVTGEVTPE